MAKKQKLTAKELSTVEYYCEPISETRNNWSQSYLRAGYSKCKGWKVNACRVLAKDYIKDAIRQARSKIKENIAVSREYCIEKLYNIAETNKDDRIIISALSTIGDFAGFKRELAPSTEREQLRRGILDKELAELERLCRERTAELSEPGTGTSAPRPVIRKIG